MTAGVLLTLALMSASPLDGVKVEVTLDPPVIPFHKQADFTISVEAPADAQVKLPEMVGHFGGLNVYGTPTYRSEELDNDRVRISETYRLDPVLIGNYAIDPVEVTIGEGESIQAPSPALRVRDLTDEERAEAEKFEAALADPNLADPAFYLRWPFWAVIGALAIVGIIAAYLRFRGRREKEAPVVTQTPWEIAFARLRLLDQRQYPKSGRFDPYYVDLSAILRYYIEDRFHVHAPEQTTPEFLAAIAGTGMLSVEHERMLATFLRHCDRVKFAKYEPTVNEMERSFSQVLQFIDETIPRVEGAPAEDAA